MPEPAADERQLLAIMFTDVVGYAALTERDEAMAVRARDRHRELVSTLVKQFDGEVIDATGDESLSVFHSAVRAVDCALALQGALRSHPDLKLRIGIHLGDVLRRGGEVIGDGVNVAARIRPLAAPGAICISEPVWQLVRNRAHIRARSLGLQALKNVTAPMTVHVVESTDSPRPERGRRILLSGVFAALVGLAGLAYVERVAIGTWLALNLPRVLGHPVKEQIAFATTSDGVRIAYATAGQGPPLVMVLGWLTHLTDGLGSALYDSAGVGSWYTRDHLLVHYDGRGFGLSDRNVTDFSLDARVRDLEAVVAALHLDRFDLYGFSAGGPTAIAYAARNPERVTHLVLGSTFVHLGGQDMFFRGFAGLARENWSSPAARAAVAEILAPGSSGVERGVLLHFLETAGDGQAVAGFVDAVDAVDVREEARRVRAPTLVVAGTADTALSLDAVRAVAAAIPGARFEILDGANHLEASVLDPRMMRLVSEFIARPAESP